MADAQEVYTGFSTASVFLKKVQNDDKLKKCSLRSHWFDIRLYLFALINIKP